SRGRSARRSALVECGPGRRAVRSRARRRAVSPVTKGRAWSPAPAVPLRIARSNLVTLYASEAVAEQSATVWTGTGMGARNGTPTQHAQWTRKRAAQPECLRRVGAGPTGDGSAEWSNLRDLGDIGGPSACAIRRRRV